MLHEQVAGNSIVIQVISTELYSDAGSLREISILLTAIFSYLFYKSIICLNFSENIYLCSVLHHGPEVDHANVLVFDSVGLGCGALHF